ncbi:MAG: hypothetical protein V1855_02785 [bacterium]
MKKINLFVLTMLLLVIQSSADAMQKKTVAILKKTTQLTPSNLFRAFHLMSNKPNFSFSILEESDDPLMIGDSDEIFLELDDTVTLDEKNKIKCIMVAPKLTKKIKDKTASWAGIIGDTKILALVFKDSKDLFKQEIHTLDLSDNDLGLLPREIEYLKNLKHLILKNNSLLYLPIPALQKLEFLETIDLNGNTELDPNYVRMIRDSLPNVTITWTNEKYTDI